ncbi:MAG: GH32 C-terminal domain-containing protein, partial [Firmicutes bacterium]|nr:GH32 C-terminal domain-containing protein [Bacillota bacterium]
APKSRYYSGIHGNSLEISAYFAHFKKGRAGIRLVSPSKDFPDTVIFYDAGTGEFGIEGGVRFEGKGPAYADPNKDIELRIFTDRQVVEVFTEGQTCTSVFSGLPSEDTEVVLFSEEDNAVCRKLTVWSMANARRK